MYTNLAELFEPYSERLDAFATRHNLEVEKYRHDVPCWRFLFHHPKGGVGYVDIQINIKEEVFLLKYWIIDDYDQFTRRSAHEPGEKIDNPLECLEDKMLAAIKEIIAWDEDRLVQRGGISRGSPRAPATPRQYPTPIM